MYCTTSYGAYDTGMIKGFRPANEGRRYKVTPSLHVWSQIWNQSCDICAMQFIKSMHGLNY